MRILPSKSFKLSIFHKGEFCEKIDELENELSRLYKITENSRYDVGNCVIRDYVSPNEVIEHAQEYGDGFSVDEVDLDECSFIDLPFNGFGITSSTRISSIDKKYGIENALFNSMLYSNQNFGSPNFIIIKSSLGSSPLKSLFFTKESEDYYNYLKLSRFHYNLDDKYSKLLKLLDFSDFKIDESGDKIISEPKKLLISDIINSAFYVRNNCFLKKSVFLEFYYDMLRLEYDITNLDAVFSINVEKNNKDILEALRMLNNFFGNELKDLMSIVANVSGKIL